MSVVLRCEHCGYEWTTKGDHIPAHCPSCHARIHGTDNFEQMTNVSIRSSNRETDWKFFKAKLILGVIVIIVVIGLFWSTASQYKSAGDKCTVRSDCGPDAQRNSAGTLMCYNGTCVDCCVTNSATDFCLEDADCHYISFRHSPTDKCINNHCVYQKS